MAVTDFASAVISLIREGQTTKIFYEGSGMISYFCILVAALTLWQGPFLNDGDADLVSMWRWKARIQECSSEKQVQNEN